MECSICKIETGKSKPARGCKNIYCGKKCSGIGRRLNKSIEQLKKEKQEYDKAYREKNVQEIKRKKKIYFSKDYALNPEKYKQQRIKKYKKHLEYLQRPEYKKYKSNYDQKYLAKKEYGVFWECALLLKELEVFLIENRPDGLHFKMGITNKTQNRRKLWQKTIRQKSSQQRA